MFKTCVIFYVYFCLLNVYFINIIEKMGKHTLKNINIML